MCVHIYTRVRVCVAGVCVCVYLVQGCLSKPQSTSMLSGRKDPVIQRREITAPAVA